MDEDLRSTVRRPSLPRNGAVVAASMLVGNAINYAFQVVMSRLLGPASFGALGALLALSFIISVPGLALQTIVARHTALRDHRGEDVRALWSGVLRSVLLVGVGFAVAGVVASPVVAGFLHLRSIAPALWLSASLLMLPILPAVMGMVQGRERFVALSVTLLVSTAARLPIAWALVQLGFGVSGAMAGAALASLLGAGIGIWLVRPGLRGGRVGGVVLTEMWSAGIGILGLFLAVNLDIVLARHYLPPRASGLYAAGTVIAKITYWAPRFVVVVIFPRLVVSRDRRSLVGRGAAAVLLFSGAVVAVVASGSHVLLRLMFGASYVALGSALWIFAAIGTLFAVVQLLLFSQIAVGDVRLGRVLLGAVAVKTALIVAFFHSSVMQIAAVVAAAAFGVLAIAAYVEYEPGRRAAPQPAAPALGGSPNPS